MLIRNMTAFGRFVVAGFRPASAPPPPDRIVVTRTLQRVITRSGDQVIV